MKLSLQEAEQEWKRYHVRNAPKEMRQDVYTNLYLKAVYNRLNSYQEGGEGYKIGGNGFPANSDPLSVGTHANEIEHSEQNYSMRSSSLLNRSLQEGTSQLIDLCPEACDALVPDGNSDVLDPVPNVDSPVLVVNNSDQTTGYETPIILPPSECFQDAGSVKDIAGQSVQPNLQFDYTSGQIASRDADQLRRDAVLQIVAERNVFHRDSADSIAARIHTRVNSVLSRESIDSILFALSVHDKMFIDKICDVISSALSTESSGHLAIAMLLTELRSRSSVI